MKSLLTSQTVKTAMGIIIGLGVVVAIAFAVDANTNRGSIDQADAKRIALKEASSIVLLAAFLLDHHLFPVEVVAFQAAHPAALVAEAAVEPFKEK